MSPSTWILLSIFGAGLFIQVHAQGGAYAQCGGIGWAGATTCVSGYTCTVSSEYYSQCLPDASTTVATGTGTGTSSAPTPTGSQIRSVEDPVYHFYLQDNGTGTPVLGPESSSGYFTIGSTIALSPSSGSSSTGILYLNLANTTTSYKPLTLDSTATTTDWALEGDTIITTTPRELNYLACPTDNADVYDVYLQEGTDVPGDGCSMATLHLPCLC